MQMLVRGIDFLNEWIGRLTAWLSLAMVVLILSIVILRYGFDIGSIALQESGQWLHALIFMLGAAFTLKHKGHVRVDVFYSRFDSRKKAIVDALGTLLLLTPLCVYLIWISWDDVLASWQSQETSKDAGGLQVVYVFKTVIVVMPVLLLLQAIAELLRPLLAGRQQQDGAA